MGLRDLKELLKRMILSKSSLDDMGKILKGDALKKLRKSFDQLIIISLTIASPSPPRNPPLEY